MIKIVKFNLKNLVYPVQIRNVDKLNLKIYYSLSFKI
jgi:hypothetical protein